MAVHRLTFYESESQMSFVATAGIPVPTTRATTVVRVFAGDNYAPRTPGEIERLLGPQPQGQVGTLSDNPHGTPIPLLQIKHVLDQVSAGNLTVEKPDHLYFLVSGWKVLHMMFGAKRKWYPTLYEQQDIPPGVSVLAFMPE